MMKSGFAKVLKNMGDNRSTRRSSSESDRSSESGRETDRSSESDRSPHKVPFIIGVAGGTASGKTTVCDVIIAHLRDQRVVLVNQDAFYRSLNNEELKKVGEYNFDHPDAFDTEVLLSCMEKLKRGSVASIPNYDFKTHKSVEPGRQLHPYIQANYLAAIDAKLDERVTIQKSEFNPFDALGSLLGRKDRHPF